MSMDHDFTMEDAHEILRTATTVKTEVTYTTPMYLPFDAMFIAESFNGMSDETADVIKNAYRSSQAATAGSAGIDLRYVGRDEISLAPGECRRVGTGIAIHIAQPAFVGIIAPRSGLGSKGLVLGNTIGVIDSDYTGELQIALWNRTTDETLVVAPGDRIAQYMVIRREAFCLNMVEALPETERGAGGFGHTGVR